MLNLQCRIQAVHIPDLVSVSLRLWQTQSFHLPGIPSKGKQPGRASCGDSHAKQWSGQIIIFHQPRFSWNKGNSLTKPPFGVRSCEVAIIWPEWWKLLFAGNSDAKSHQEFQVPKMEGVNLIAGHFGAGETPVSISLIYSVYHGEDFLHFRYLKCLVKKHGKLTDVKHVSSRNLTWTHTISIIISI